jgi:hypothetical protein
MKMKSLALLLVLAGSPALADPIQVDAALAGIDDADCATLACRPGGNRVTLQIDDHRSAQFTVPKSPHVTKDGAIIVYPGETWMFRFSGPQDNPGLPVFVGTSVVTQPQHAPPSDFSFKGDATTDVQHDPKTGENVYTLRKGSPFAEGGTAEEHLKGEPPGTLIVSYNQTAGHPDMVLRVEHNFPGSIKYDAAIELLSANRPGSLKPTSTCPVRSVLSGMESWPYPLGAITLRNFRFVETGTAFNCD